MRHVSKILFILIGVVLTQSLIPQPTATAHRDGCHSWHSCPSDSGSYVCGDTGHSAECPESAPVQQQPKTSAPPAQPRQPVARQPILKTKTVSSDEIIPFASEAKYTSKEYQDYSKITQEGANGKKRTYTEITYADGRETGRKVIKDEVINQPQTKVTTAGNRIKPKAVINSINKTKKKDKFDVKGRYKSNSEVVLELNGKKIKKTKTDKNGDYVFKGIKINKNDSDLKIHKREKKKESQVSEKTYVNTSATSLKTEYQKFGH